MIRLFTCAIVVALSLPSASALAQGAAAVTVIRNATVLTVTKGTIDKGSVVIRNGKITAVGANVDVPRGATEIDGSGLYLMPGIIDAHSHIAVDGSVNE